MSGLPRSAHEPADLTGMLKVVGHLFELSVVHYELAAVASEKAFQALERAVRIKLRAAEKTRYKALIDSLGDRLALPREQIDMIDTGRQLRNLRVGHPKNSGEITLIMAAGHIERSFELIAAVMDATHKISGS